MMYRTTTNNVAEAARLEDYLQAIRQRKWLVLALALLGLIGAFLFATSRTNTYTATSVVLLRPSPEGAIQEGREEAPNLEREQEVLASNGVASAVVTNNGLNTGPDALLKDLEVQFTPDSDVMRVSYTTTSPETAALVANSFAGVYAEQREAAARNYYQSLVDTAAAEGDAAQEARVAVQAQLADAQQARALAAELGSSTELATLDAELAEYRTEVANYNAQVRAAAVEVREANQRLTSRLPSAEVLRNATPPTDADGIGLPLTMIGGLLLGLLAGVVAAFLLERLDTTARDEEDVALALGTTVMGSIPTLGFGLRGGAGSLVMLSSGGSARIAAAREAFRRLRSSIQFLNSSNGVSSIIVTSASPAEGKSLTSSNLAIALSQNGSRVVLVSADLRRPSLERLFGMEAANRPGLAEYLSNVAELNAEKIPGIENMWIIRAGRPPDNPGELLSSDRFEQMIKELERESVDYIVVDTPPVLSTADAVSAARYVDGVLVVVDTERTETTDLLQVRADLERSGSNLLGAVMNRQQFQRGGLFRRDKYAYYRTDNR